MPPGVEMLRVPETPRASATSCVSAMLWAAASSWACAGAMGGGDATGGGDAIGGGDAMCAGGAMGSGEGIGGGGPMSWGDAMACGSLACCGHVTGCGGAMDRRDPMGCGNAKDCGYAMRRPHEVRRSYGVAALPCVARRIVVVINIKKLINTVSILQECKFSHKATVDIKEQRGIVSRVVEANSWLVDVASISEDLCDNPSLPSATM